MTFTATKLNNSIDKLQNWVEKHDFKGYEPFDGLNSYLRPFTFNNWLAERILQQLVLRSPYNLRPLLGVKSNFSTKGMSFLARAYLRMWKINKDEKWKKKGIFCLDWLIENQSKGYSGAAWGNHFDYSSRGFQLPRYTPTEVWVGLIGQAFLDGYETLGIEKYLTVARSACNYILKDLPRTGFNDSFCISYVTFKKLLIHNSNMLGAALLARTYAVTGEPELLETSKKAVRFTCNHQLENGGWYYGVGPKYRWIDNWHTAYNLDSLKCFMENTGDNSFNKNLKIGYEFFKNTFFTPEGKSKFYHDRLSFVDIQSASQAIDTFSYFSDYDQEEALTMAGKITKWTIKNMQDSTGYFYYRDLGWKKVKTPMLHWGQATMMSGLSHLLFKLNVTI